MEQLQQGKLPDYLCYEKFLPICRTAALGCPWRRLESLRHRSFHALRVDQRPMRNCSEKSFTGASYAPMSFRPCGRGRPPH